MPVMSNRYGARSLNEVRHQSHAFKLRDLSMLNPGMEQAVDLAMEKSLKQLGEGVEIGSGNHWRTASTMSRTCFLDTLGFQEAKIGSTIQGMTVDDRVVTFLKENKGKSICDACLCLRITRPEGGHINSTQASNATRPLRNVGGFQVSPGECVVCREYRQKVTKAI